MINPFLTEHERKGWLREENLMTDSTALIVQEFLRIRWMELENKDVRWMSFAFHMKPQKLWRIVRVP